MIRVEPFLHESVWLLASSGLAGIFGNLLLGNSIFPRDRAEKAIKEENNTERPELKIILVLIASIGVMFLGLWVISQEAFPFSRLMGILIFSAGLDLFFCNGMQGFRAQL